MEKIVVWTFNHAVKAGRFHKCTATRSTQPPSTVEVSVESAIDDWDGFIDAIELEMKDGACFNVVILHCEPSRQTEVQTLIADNPRFGLIFMSNRGREGLADFQSVECKAQGVVAITDITADVVVSELTRAPDSRVKCFLDELLRVFSAENSGNARNSFVECFYLYFPDKESESEIKKGRDIASFIDQYYRLSLSTCSPDLLEEQRDLIAKLRVLGVTIVADHRE